MKYGDEFSRNPGCSSQRRIAFCSSVSVAFEFAGMAQ